MAIHVLDEANRCLNCKVPQCQKGCPIHTPIPTVIQLMLNGKLDEAGWMLFENNPLTTVCSLVCNHENQCEGHCVLGKKALRYIFQPSKTIFPVPTVPKWSKALLRPMESVWRSSVPVLPA